MDLLWFFSDLRTPFLTACFRFFTLFGEEMVIVSILCALYWCRDKELAFGVCIAFFVSTLLVQGMKIAFRIDRPWILDPAFQPIGDALHTATGYSFPSGHTQSAASLYGYLGLASGKKKWIISGWVLVALVALSRMYLGVHTLLDVSVSMLLSLIVSLSVLAYLRSKRSDLALVGVLGALSVAVILFALSLHARGIIETKYLADSCKAAGGCIGCAVGFYWVRTRIPFSTKTPLAWQQPIKLSIGLAVTLLIQSGVKLLLGDHLIIDTLRYFAIALWVLALYPLVFTRVLKRA